MLFNISNAYMSGHVSLCNVCLFYTKRVQHMFGGMWDDRNFDGGMWEKIMAGAGFAHFNRWDAG